jgi:two-component system sensor histidine kinase TctE
MRLLSKPRNLLRQPTEFNSLFGEILDWMLAPLLFLWPISIVVTHDVANNIANVPYDQSLAENVKAVSRLIKVDSNRLSFNFPAPARALLHADEEDTVYYQVLGAGGELVSGDRDIPSVDPPADLRPDTVYFRDDEANGEDLRVAWQYLRPGPGADLPLIVVQVAETRTKRSNLASRIVAGVLLPQFAIIPLAVVLVYFGLGRGIAPLNRLQRLIQRRRPSDLSPISTHGLPEEVGPVILAFNDMMARLEQNLQAQQRFIADAAHQMRTPLTGLKMQADLALAEEDPEQLHRSLQKISEGADRAAHLINQLLSLARAEASFEKIHTVEATDLEALVREVTHDMALRAMAKHMDFGFEGTGWPLMIDGVPALVRELVKNLVDNAIKYTPDGGKITVRVKAGEFALVEVEDTGIGIAESDRELVFERFHRVLGSGAEGSGLGLPIVREIADLHRANVLLKPNPGGRGTLAQVIFPRRRVGSVQTALEAGALPIKPARTVGPG